MLFRTHLAFSFLLFLGIIKIVDFSFSETVFFGFFLFLATLFVDIDSRNSKVGRKLIFRPVQFFLVHRGMIHSLFFCFIFTYFVFLLDKISAYGFLVGYLSHLFLDLLSREGVVLFWPFSKVKISLLGIKVGSIFEEIFFVLLLLGNIFIVGLLIF